MPGPNFTVTFGQPAPNYAPERRVEVSVPPVSSTSGKPCTFFGGMEAAREGCVNGAMSKNPLTGCVEGAAQSTAVHTAGCVKVEQKEFYVAKR